MERKIYDLKEARLSIRHYCAKEDRCQQQVLDKLYAYGLSKGTCESLLLELIQEKFVDEERFARSFCSGKFRIKKWGRNKITFELKKKAVPTSCIQLGLSEIEEEEYLETLLLLLQKKQSTVKETNHYIRKKKIADFAIRKGYEPSLVWEQIDNL
jgi:regulatory protein